MKELTLKLLRNNFTLWKEATYDELALSNDSEYIDFILTGVQWTQQEIMESDYLPTFGDGIELTAAEKKTYRSTHSTKKLDEWARARKTILPRIAVAIRMSLSKEIEEDLKGHPDYAAWKGLAAGITGRGTDPHGLLNMLTDICGRKRFADNDVLQAIDNNEMRVRLHTNKQLYNESCVAYKQRFEELAKEMESCGLTIPNELELSIIFAEGLKPGTKQRKYMDELKSKCAHCPEDYPKTIAEVWKIVTNVTMQEHSSAPSTDRSKREEDGTHNQPRVKDDRSNPNNSGFGRGRTRPSQRPEQVNKPNEGPIPDAAPAKRVFALTGRVDATYEAQGICDMDRDDLIFSQSADHISSQDFEAEPGEFMEQSVALFGESDEYSVYRDSDKKKVTFEDDPVPDDEDYSKQLQDEIEQYLTMSSYAEAHVMLMMTSSDSNCNDHIRPDFKTYSYAGRECLEIKQSTHAYLEDEDSTEPLGEGLFATAMILRTTPIINFQGTLITREAAENTPYPDSEYMIQISNETVLDCTSNALGYSLPRCYGSKANDPHQAWCNVRKRYLTREDANAQVISLYDGENYHCVLYAISDINIGDEILWNYLFAPESDDKESSTSVEEVIEPVNKRIKVSDESLVDQCSGEEDRTMLLSANNKAGFDHYSRQTVNDSSNTSILPNPNPHLHVYMQGGMQVSPGVVRGMNHTRQPEVAIDDSDLTPTRADSNNTHYGDPNTYKKAEVYVTAISSRKKDNNNTTLLLDSQAGISIFKNENLLKNIKPLDRPIRLMGINESGSPILADRAGMHKDLGVIAICTQASANVISMADMIDKGHKVMYNSSDDTFSLQPSNNADEILFKRLGKHYASIPDYHVLAATYKATDNNVPGTPAARSTIYTKADKQRATFARMMQSRLGYIPSSDFERMKIQGVDIAPRDIAIADHIFGPCEATLKGCTVKRASPAIVPGQTMKIEENQTLEVDIMFVSNIPFLIGILVPLGHALVQYIPRRTNKEVHRALEGFISEIQSRKINITYVVSDNEKAVLSMERTLNDKGIIVSSTAAGEKAHRVERRIRFIKERTRSIVHSLPYQLNALLLTYAVYHATWLTNLHIPTNATTTLSPHEMYTGRHLNAARDLRHTFGDYVQATRPHTDNSMQSRTEGHIALVSSGSLTGGVNMYCIATGKIRVRDQFKTIAIKQDLIDHMNALAKKDDMPSVDDDLPENHFDPSDDIPAGPQRPTTLTTTDFPSATMQPAAVQRGEATPQGPKSTRSTAHIRKQGENLATHLDMVDRRPNPHMIHLEDYPSSDEDEDHNKENGVHEEVHRTENGVYWDDDDDRVTILNITVANALKTHGDEARASIKKELTQLLNKKAWTPVKARFLPKEERKRRIRSSMFLKEKFDAEGKLDKLKSRLVAGGHMQDKSLYEDLSSPTASLSSVFILCAVAAHEKRKVASLDVTGAYLNADMQTGIKVHMILSRQITDILLEIDSAYREFVDERGELLVQLDKALYGCVESAKLWHDHLTKTLAECGFKQNPYDPCLYQMTALSGDKCDLVVHVDDLLITAREQGTVDGVIAHLKSRYKDTNEVSGEKHNYLGMVLDFTTPGECKVAMPGYEKFLLEDSDNVKKYPTPARDDLFDIDAESPALEEPEAKRFHTGVAKLLYLCMRARPECLVAVAFLCTRVTKSTAQDADKLDRVLGYIRKHEGGCVVLRPGKKGIVSELYTDSSYGVHPDAKSHSGSAVNIGDGAMVHWESGKQQGVTKSSTEAEFVCLSDCLNMLIHVREKLEHMGYPQGTSIVHQDNMSTMALAKAGRPMHKRSRHISIRHFWVTEQVKRGAIKIIHCPTEMMIANMLTKPLQGSQFHREKAMMTNEISPTIDAERGVGMVGEEEDTV